MTTLASKMQAFLEEMGWQLTRQIGVRKVNGKKCRKMKGLTVDLSFCFLFMKDENLRQKEKK